MNNSFRVFVFISIFLHVNGDLFDRYSGKKFDDQRTKELRLKKYVDKCAIDIKACAAHEVSRVTGTCNNYNFPAAGAAGRPYLRLLEPEYTNQYEIRKGKGGEALPSARTVGESIVIAKHIQEMRQEFSSAAFHFLELIRKDVSVMKETSVKGQDCCSKAEQDPRCIPIHAENTVKAPDCFNFSRAETFQDLGCTHDVTPSQVNYQTPLLDLSIVYGVDEESLKSVRSYKNGLLKLELRGNRTLPLKLNETDCLSNSQNCYNIGLPKVISMDVRTTALAVFFTREHNRLARLLHELNPCWKDDRLFKVARQINIATASHILLYELMPKILGYNNMLTYDLISIYAEHITAYDIQTEPGVYVEFDTALRFFNTLLDEKIVKYNEKYENVGEDELAEVSQNSLEINSKFDEIIRGTFVQSAGSVQDNEQGTNSSDQRMHDQISFHVQRGRDLGLRGYNEYRTLCGLKSAKDFPDLLDVIDGERIEKLKSLYKSVEDIDLLVGAMSENNIQGTYVGPTLFCILVKQLQIFRLSDRFWFERGDNYHSFSLSQLREIRRTNTARLVCDNAEAISVIQPYALLTASQWNTPIPCSEISGANLEEWRDTSCKENNLINRLQTSKSQTYPQFSSFFNDILSSAHL